MTSVIPLIDGGTEGFKGNVRVVLPGISACVECTLDLYPPQVSDLYPPQVSDLYPPQISDLYPPLVNDCCSLYVNDFYPSYVSDL